MKTKSSSDPALANLAGLLPDLEALYKDVHSHPELSMQETRTAGIVADRLRAAGYEVATGIGKTGVVGLLRNGDGPAVMLRADMDALPVAEATGLPDASTATATDAAGKTVPVAHACSHDIHVTWLVGATTLFAQARASWSGTVLAVFQPGEETAQGAQAMIDDGLFDRFPKPDVVLGQHVMPSAAGSIGTRSGVITSGLGKRSKSPSSIIACAPCAVSSAGWKTASTVPRQASRADASSAVTPASQVTCMSCPHACMTGTSLPSGSVAVAVLA